MDQQLLDVVVSVINIFTIPFLYVFFLSDFRWSYIWMTALFVSVPVIFFLVFPALLVFHLPAVLITVFLGSFFILKEPLKKILLSLVLTLCGIILGGGVVFNFIMTALTNMWDQYFVNYIVSHLLMCILVLPPCYIIGKAYRKRNIMEVIMNNSIVVYIIFFVILVIVEIGVVLIQEYYSRDNPFPHLIIIMPLILTVTIGFSFFFLYLYSRIEKKNLVLLHKEKELEQSKLYTDLIENLVVDTRQFKHDYKNMILSLEGYLNKRDYEGLQNFFSSRILPIQQDLEQNSILLNNVIRVKELSLKGLLISKIQYALRFGLDVKVQISSEIEIKHMDELDICRIMGILLDNAVEASIQSNRKELLIYACQEEDNVFFSISNTFTGRLDVVQLKTDGFSTKGENRGIGLSSFRKILQRYPEVIVNWEVSEYCTCSLSI